jgi:hypothetical protein
MDYLTNPSARRDQRYQKKGKNTQASQRFQAATKISLFTINTSEKFLRQSKKITRGARIRHEEKVTTAQEEFFNV